jgi:ABC-type transport system involved in cytochrome bd biosynthesis fused ATPase/permease subunit
MEELKSRISKKEYDKQLTRLITMLFQNTIVLLVFGMLLSVKSKFMDGGLTLQIIYLFLMICIVLFNLYFLVKALHIIKWRCKK